MKTYENYFFPFDRAETHEDQLTRALIVLIKLVPAVEVLFLDQIREAQRSNPKREPRFPLPNTLGATSRGGLFTQVGSTVWESIPQTQKLVSVLLTNEKLAKEPTVTNSSRDARYDAVFYYNPDLAIVVENKPLVGNVWTDQLNPNVGERPIEIDPVPAVVLWSDIIQGINDLDVRGVLEGTDRRLIQDFLSYVQATYPQLYPYRSLHACSRLKEPLQKRCQRLLTEVGGGKEIQRQVGWKPYLRVEGVATHIALDVWSGEDDKELLQIQLEFYPGDTMGQAREFFENLDIPALLKLRNEGWIIEPNLHLAHITKNVVSFSGPLPIEEYLAYWKANPKRIAKARKKDQPFQTLFQDWKALGFARQEDYNRFEEKILKTKRDDLNVCPGVGIKYRWPIELAESLDRDGRFVEEIRERIVRPMATWGQSFRPI